MAALTRSGARKASEIVMLTLRGLQPASLAIDSMVAVGSVVSSTSQRRPRAMAAMRRARLSERMGRAASVVIVSETRISRRRVDDVLRQGISIR
jgi:hypothetical protein